MGNNAAAHALRSLAEKSVRHTPDVDLPSPPAALPEADASDSPRYTEYVGQHEDCPANGALFLDRALNYTQCDGCRVEQPFKESSPEEAPEPADAPAPLPPVPPAPTVAEFFTDPAKPNRSAKTGTIRVVLDSPLGRVELYRVEGIADLAASGTPVLRSSRGAAAADDDVIEAAGGAKATSQHKLPNGSYAVARHGNTRFARGGVMVHETSCEPLFIFGFLGAVRDATAESIGKAQPMYRFPAPNLNPALARDFVGAYLRNVMTTGARNDDGLAVALPPFHETQEGQQCSCHAINNLFRGLAPHVTTADLDAALERARPLATPQAARKFNQNPTNDEGKAERIVDGERNIVAVSAFLMERGLTVTRLRKGSGRTTRCSHFIVLKGVHYVCLRPSTDTLVEARHMTLPPDDGLELVDSMAAAPQFMTLKQAREYLDTYAESDSSTRAVLAIGLPGDALCTQADF
jgi:hypothetical protein